MTKPENKRENFDLIVIGGGSGGLTMTSVAAQLGYKVALLEGGKMGGDCLNYGCVPSKSLIAAAKKVHTARASQKFGLEVRAQPDMAAVHHHVHGAIKAIAPHDSQERFESLGAKVIREHGFFINKDTIGTESGKRLQGRRIVIATGSHPLVPPIEGLKDAGFYTNETIFDLQHTPKHLLIAGGGPIGVEMAQAFARLGSQVTLVEGGPQILGPEDRDVADALEQRLADEGVTVLKNHKITQVERKNKEKITLTLTPTLFDGDSGSDNARQARKGEKKTKTVTGTDLLVSLGRQPNTHKLELANAGIDMNGRFIQTDATLRTTNKQVFAVGDVAGNYQFTHMAGYEAAHVIKRVLFGVFWAKVRYQAVPWCTYTDPEVATVGLSQKAAQAKYGNKVTTTTTHFTENDRAQAEGNTAGFIKLNTVKGKPVGVTIFGPGAGDLIGLWTLALDKKLPLSAISGMIHPYPTRNDISRQVVSDFYKPAFLSNKVRRVSHLMFRLFG